MNGIITYYFDTFYHSLSYPGCLESTFHFFCLPVQPPLLEDCKLFETLFEGDMATQAKEEWEKAMSELAQEEPELLQHFQKLSEAAGKVGKANHIVVLIAVLSYYFAWGSLTLYVVLFLCRY